jgi:hypothetical protein
MEAIHFDHSTNLADKYVGNGTPIAGAGSYSVQFLLRNNGIPRNNLFSAIKKAMELFSEAGINVRHHFKKIFVVNEDGTTTYVDWFLTQRALDLTLKHCNIFRINPWIVPN